MELLAKTYYLGQKVGDKFMKYSKIGFSMGCFKADFFAVSFRKRSKFSFRVDSWVLAITCGEEKLS